ncbi:hypothetical protein [Arthrobacter methylotrophus]|uniref:hypothetical protein n=1 Tax=Arthrobacter methylotrophus TaxID=121291 RepID=UPI0031E8A9F9
MISSITSASGVPTAMRVRRKSRATCPIGGCTITKTGSREAACHQRQGKALEAAEVAGGRGQHHQRGRCANAQWRGCRGTPAQADAMNSVTSVSAFTRNRSMTEKLPQNLPKRAKISRAWPTR